MTSDRTAGNAPDKLAGSVFIAIVAATAVYIGIAAAEAGFGPAGIMLCSLLVLSLAAVAWLPVIALGAFVLAGYGVFRYSDQFDAVLRMNLPSWIAGLGFIGWIIALAGSRQKPQIDDWLTVTMFCFVSWVGITIVAAWGRGEAFDYSHWNHPAQYLQGLALFLIAAHTMRRQSLSWALALLLCALPALQAMQRASRGIHLESDLPLLGAMLFPFAALGALFAPHRAMRVIFGLLGLNMLVIIVLAQNRAAAVGLGVAVVFLWWSSRHRTRWALIGIPAIALAGWLVVPKDYADRFRAIWDTQATQRSAQRDRGTVQGRLNLWDGAVRMLADHPIVGVGAGNYSRAAADYLRRKTRLPAHNSILHVGAEMGLPGALLYVALFVGAVLTLQLRIRRDPVAWPAPMARILQASLAAYLAGGLFMSRQDMQLAYLMLGWAVALLSRVEPRQVADPRPAPELMRRRVLRERS
ncbi:MAG: O-antigen ligase family protein [Burkholderiales bacterium]|nr:O-antigen ligase family protein [Burkholderiales bacterium]